MTERRLDHLPRVEVTGLADLRDWLETNHATAGSHWLILPRKGQPGYSDYDTVVCELLCYGWVDSLPRALDARRTMLLISPRKPGSNWSKDNRERVERLERRGLLAPAGGAAVATARGDGSWDRLRETERGEPPPDLAGALDQDPRAREGWQHLSLAARRRTLENLLSAKRPATREARIARIVRACLDGQDPSTWRPQG